MLISLYSPDGQLRRATSSSTTAAINLRDQLLRIPGIAQVDLFGGTDYGMRIWLRAGQARQARADPVRRDLGHQGAEPAGAGRQDRRRAVARRTRRSPTRSARPAASITGRRVREHHHARDRHRRADAHPGRRARRARLAELRLLRPAERQAVRRDGRLPAPRREPAQGGRDDLRDDGARPRSLFPPDVDYKIVYDTTPAVEASIESIVHTFVEAVILVTLVVFIFLQNFRATLIPLLTVPVSLDRHLHLLPDARLLGQHALDVRPRARDRHRGATTRSSWSRR